MGNDRKYAVKAEELGRKMAEQNIALVYGGGHLGLMGVIADSVLAHGGEVVGIIPERLVRRENAHTRLTQSIVVEGMHERKALMARMSDAFVSMPGGLGTLDELFEIMTWNQLGIIDKPCVLYNVNRYWDAQLQMLHTAHEEGFVNDAGFNLLKVYDDADDLLKNVFSPNAKTKA
jgi:hypothetical protein